MELKGLVVLENKVIPAEIEVKDGLIYAVYPIDEPATNLPIIMPGFIDQHIHGANSADAMDATFDALNTISKAILKEGVTSFLATTMTASPDSIEKATKAAAAAIGKVEGANLLGVHLEGPFINCKYKGAQPEELIQPIDLKKLDIWNHEGVIKLITAAPELDNFKKLLEYSRANKISVQIGHTAATYDQVVKALKKGANGFTHAYNAMSGFAHREAGVVGAMLLSKEAYAELIADGIHVSIPAIKLLYENKGFDRIILVTDSIRATGLTDGVSELGGQKVIVKDNEARLESGALAGSILKYNDGVRHMALNIENNLIKLSKMSSLNPAANLGIDKQKGSIKVGKDADLVILDHDFNVLKTIIKGEIKYEV